MTTCPNCSTELPDGARFCSSCGSEVESACPDCGTTVPPAANFCPNCRAELDSGPASSDDGDGPLRLAPTEFARRLDGEALDADGLLGWLTRKKTVTIEAGNEALFLDAGEVVATLGPGKHTLDSLGQQLREFRSSKRPVVILVEQRDTTVTIRQEVHTVDEYPLAVAVELTIGVTDPERLYTGLLADRGDVTAETFQSVLGGAIRDELQATVADHHHEDLRGNRELKATLREGLRTACGSTLERYGLELVTLRSLRVDDDRDELREKRKEVTLSKEEAEIAEERAEVERRERERETDDTVHEERQRVREETAGQSADHEIETQAVEQDHEIDDMERRHEHKAEREDVEHREDVKTTKKEKEVQRRDIEHEQDIDEMEDLMDLKKRKDMDDLDVDEREQEMEMRREEHEVEVERERLEARDEVDLSTLASMDSVDEAVAELAELEKAEDLTPEQLEAIGAKDSDELAKARQEAHNAEAERKRVEDHEEFREEVKEMAEQSMDRMQETTESAMDNMGETGRAAAEDTSDNVIVSDTGSANDGDTTIVQGGGGGDSGGSSGDEPERRQSAGGDGTPTGSGADGDGTPTGSGDGGETAAGSGADGDGTAASSGDCPSCGADVAPDDDFCLTCGEEL